MDGLDPLAVGRSRLTPAGERLAGPRQTAAGLERSIR
jgi:hypothetical protein